MKSNLKNSEETLKPKVCPRCNSENIVDIVYGYPLPETKEKASKGEVKLGGCGIYDGMPIYHCKDCGYEFGGKRSRFAHFIDQD
jgi:transcription elongation factor Elf1